MHLSQAQQATSQLIRACVPPASATEFFMSATHTIVHKDFSMQMGTKTSGPTSQQDFKCHASFDA